MRFGSTAKVLLKCKLKYYRISEWMASSCQHVHHLCSLCHHLDVLQIQMECLDDRTATVLLHFSAARQAGSDRLTGEQANG